MPLALPAHRLLGVLFAFFGGVLVIQLCGAVVVSALPSVWGVILPYLAMAGWGAVVLRIGMGSAMHLSIPAMVDLRPERWRPQWIWQVPLGLGALGLTFWCVSGLMSWCGFSPDLALQHQQYRTWLAQPGSAAALLLLAVFLAPVLEEAFFRGFLLRALLNAGSSTVAICASAFLFGLLHPLPALPITVSLGICLGCLYVAWGSLWPTMLVHAAWNILAMSLIAADIW